MADEAVVATNPAEEAPSPVDDDTRPEPEPLPLYSVTTGIETDSLRLEAGDTFDGTGLTSEQMGHLISLGAIHLVGTPAPVTPRPELTDSDTVRKMVSLAEATIFPEPLKDQIAQEGPDAAAQRAAALNNLLAQIAPTATVEQVAALDALVEPSVVVTPEVGAA